MLFFYVTIGDRIKQAREALSWSQLDLQEKSGLRVSAISQFETGKRIPNNFNLEKIADALGVTSDKLLGLDYGARRVDTDPRGFKYKTMQSILDDAEHWKKIGIFPPTEKEIRYIKRHYVFSLRFRDPEELRSAYVDLLKYILLRIRERGEVKPEPRHPKLFSE
jgi:transcriptional regulator with XRE-family HTH domain